LTTGNRLTLPQCGNEGVLYYGLRSRTSNVNDERNDDYNREKDLQILIARLSANVDNASRCQGSAKKEPRILVDALALADILY